MSYLGLDIGTSAVKAVLVDDVGKHITEADSPLTSQHPKSGWSEQNPDDWVSAVEQCCNALRIQAPNNWSAMKAVGLSGQMHGATILGEDKKPLRPAILWNDGRSSNQCNAINDGVPDIGTRTASLAR